MNKQQIVDIIGEMSGKQVAECIIEVIFDETSGMSHGDRYSLLKMVLPALVDL